VLRRDPTHPGANHYYIHAVEASPHPERALPSARRLESLVPAAGHLVHMPGHIYMRTGDYAASVETNLKAVEADRSYFRDFGKSGMYPVMYYTHNLHFVAFGSMYEGRAADTLKWTEELRQTVSGMLPPGELPPEMSMMLEMFLAQPLFARIRFQKWDDVLRLPAPDPRLVVGTALWHAGRATAYALRRDFAQAEKEKKDFETARAKVAATAGFGLNMAHDILNIAGFVLDGRLLEARGDKDFALASWKSAVEAQDGLSYDEPPDWFYPVRESLGGVLLRSGRAQEAERAFRADLEHNPRNPRSLFGLWKTLEAEKRTADAALVKEEFEAAWKNADVTLRVEDL
jgi:tetratricopeptide (TPR) repeat protein